MVTPLNTRPHVEPKLTLSASGIGRIGSDRIDLLKAIAEEGSITGAAKTLGVSYKGAWDAVLAMNNLFPCPLVEGQSGGSRGGGAKLTAKGQSVLSAMEQTMTVLETFANQLTQGEEGENEFQGLWSMMMKTTARNILHAVITDIQIGSVNAEVALDLGTGQTLAAIITIGSVKALGLEIGQPVAALIKSSFIILCDPDAANKVSARNKIAGHISDIGEGGVNTEVLIDIGQGKTLAAVVTEVSARDLGYQVGDPVVALIKASHVILMAE